MALSTTAYSAAEKPNILVIFADDLGWADIGAQGVQKDIRTPNIDLLAAGGLRATNGYVTSPQCVPSRAGLLTGRTPSRFGVDSNGSALGGFDTQETIASRLKKAGYATGMTGKWHLGPQNKIVNHGFDDVFCGLVDFIASGHHFVVCEYRCRLHHTCRPEFEYFLGWLTSDFAGRFCGVVVGSAQHRQSHQLVMGANIRADARHAAGRLGHG